MTFLNPLLLLASLGVALPILAHLLNRHRVKHTPWAAMQFLNRSVRVRSRQIRLQDLFLLLLRCLAILLLVLAFSRPATNDPDQSWLPGERRSGVIIALDSSFSMQHSDGKSTRFERALDYVDVISEQIHVGDPVSLVLLGGENKVVLQNMAFDPAKFREVMSEQKVSSERLELDNVPNVLDELTQSMVAHQKEIFILTDVQAHDWNSRWNRLREPLKELNETASVFLVPVSGNSDNLAVTELSFVSGSLRKGTTARYQATVSNFGTSPVTDIEVQCRADDVQIDSKRIPLVLPGSSKSVSLFVPFHNAGTTRITAQIAGDSVTADNVRRVVANVRDRVTVLCVDGSSGNAGRLIVSALLARDDGKEHKEFSVRSIPWLSFPQQNLDEVDVLVMANVPEVTPQQAKQLSQFVRQGNGLVWFAGDQVKVTEWNERSSNSGAIEGATATPLLPAVLGQIVDSRDALGAGKPIDPSMSDHILSQPLKSLPEDLLSETRFIKRLKVEPNSASFSVLNLAGSDSPILLEHALGRGHVVMFTTSADATWNNMALTPVFPMLMQQVVTYLAGREFETPKIVGDSLSLTYTDQPDASDAVFDTPSAKTISVPVREYRNQFVAMLENSNEAGFYTARVSVQSPGTPIAVNVDTIESDVSSLPNEELRTKLEGTGVNLATSEMELVSGIESTRTGKSSWRYFMIAAVVLLVAECLIADRVLLRKTSRRSSSQSTTVAPEANQDA